MICISPLSHEQCKTIGKRAGWTVFVCSPILGHKPELAPILPSSSWSLARGLPCWILVCPMCEGEGSGECNLGQFWFYYALHTSGRRTRIKYSFKIWKYIPKSALSWPGPFISLVQMESWWLVQSDKWFISANCYNFPELVSCPRHVALVTGWWLTKCQLEVSIFADLRYICSKTWSLSFSLA